jgi:hypothetical protein
MSVPARDAYAAGHDLTIHSPPSAAERAAVPGLPARDVPAFTGWEGELARLADLAGGGRVVVSAIGGTAGVGKTAHAPAPDDIAILMLCRRP